MNTLINLPVRVATSIEAAAIHRRAQLSERGSSTVEYSILFVVILAIGAVALKAVAGELGERLITALVNALFGKITGLFK